jgi:hypothetical protein
MTFVQIKRLQAAKYFGSSVCVQKERKHLWGLTIKFTNSPPCACSGQRPQYGLTMLAYQHFTAVLLLIYGSLFLSGIYLLSQCVLVCHCKNVGTNITFLVKLGKSGSKIRQILVQVYGDNVMKKTAVYTSGWHLFLREQKVPLTKSNPVFIQEVPFENCEVMFS